MKILKKGLCFALAFCMILSGAAFAELQTSSIPALDAPAPTPRPSGAGDWLAKLYADNGLEMESQEEAYGQIGREVSEALGMSPDGILRPGSKLLRFLTTMGNDELTGNHFQMPEGDWEKLRFMLTQGLLQYELNGKLHAEPADALGGERADLSVNMDAGIDNDQCLYMDGTVYSEVVNDQRETVIEGDDMYLRINQLTGEQRIKLPFMEELESAVGMEDSELSTILLETLSRDAVHWANAIDILYARLRSQPELLPLFRFLFEGGSTPENYVLTFDELYVLIGRTLNDLAADEAFVSELANTSLLELIHASGSSGLNLNVADMREGHRKMAIMSLLTVFSSQYARNEYDAYFEGELRVSNDRATLYVITDPGDYGSFETKLDLSYLVVGEGSFEFRATYTDQDGTSNFSWAHGKGTYDALRFAKCNRYASDTMLCTLNIDKDGVSFEFGTSLEREDASIIKLEIKRGTRPGSYRLVGELSGMMDEGLLRYELTGNGDKDSGAFELRVFGKTIYGRGQLPQEGVLVGNASYAVSGEHTDLRYTFDNTLLGFYRPIKTSYTYTLDTKSDAVALNVEQKMNDSEMQMRINAHKQADVWLGDLNVGATVLDQNVSDILSGTFMLFPDSFTAGLTFNAPDTNLHVPIGFEANWSESAINAKLEANVGAPYRILMNARMTEESAYEGTFSWQNTQAAPTDFAWFTFSPTGYSYKMNGNLFNMIPLPAVEYAMDSNPNNMRYINIIDEGTGLTGYRFSSIVESDTRHTALTILNPSMDPQTYALDSKIDVDPEGNRCAYDIRLTLPLSTESVQISLTGEDTMTLDMSSGDPLKLTQNASFRMEGPYSPTIVGNIELNHRFHVDERKHKAPKEPKRIDERIPADEADDDIAPEEEYGDPVVQGTPEEEYGDPVVQETQEEEYGDPVESVMPHIEESESVPMESEGDGSAPPDDLYDSANYTYSVDAQGVTLNAYSGEQIEMFIPYEFEDKPVTILGEGLYSGGTYIASVLLPDSIVKIGSGAFRGCIGMEWIFIPGATLEIAPDAFEGCKEDLTIVGPSGSVAETFANEHGYGFVALGDPVTDDTPSAFEAESAQEEQPDASEPDAEPRSENGLLVLEPEVIYGEPVEPAA